MFQATIGQPGVPHGDHDGLLFEAYIIRTTTNCLFQQDIHRQLPYNYVETLSTMHADALKRRSLDMSPLNCPWLSNFGPETMDMAFKTSWIYAQGYQQTLPVEKRSRFGTISTKWRSQAVFYRILFEKATTRSPDGFGVRLVGLCCGRSCLQKALHMRALTTKQ